LQVLDEVLRLLKIITKSLQSGDYFRKYSSFLHIIPKTSKSCKLISDSHNVANITNESSKLYEAQHQKLAQLCSQ
jgi:hypothetical protein